MECAAMLLRTALLLALGIAALPALAEDIIAADVIAADAIPVETAELGKSVITLHLHPFLNEEELSLLRVIMTSKEALAVFLPGSKGHSALSMAPEDGFIRAGVPTPTATALADFADAETARADTLRVCDSARKGKTPCVVVLEIAPN
jgi:hypothetical protein